MANEGTCRAEVYELYADNQQGRLVASYDDISTYKWAPRNGLKTFLKAAPDAKSGLYLVTGDGKVSIWLVQFPEYTYQSYSISKRRGDGEIKQIGDRKKENS